jgi:hypothetical protein
MNQTIAAVIDEVGLGVIADRMNTTPQRVSNWRTRGVPVLEVLSFCAAVKWKLTPHVVYPDMYPHPDDGLPVELKRAMIDVDRALVMSSLKGQQPEVPLTPLRRVTDIPDLAPRGSSDEASRGAGSATGGGSSAAGQE